MCKRISTGTVSAISGLLIIVALTSNLRAQSDEDLAKQLANPIASLISVPIEVVHDHGLGATGSGSQTAFVVKPVIPISLNENWNVISRTILPYITTQDIEPGVSQQGFGDVLQSFFLSPKQVGPSGLVWGTGPILQVPLSSNNGLGRNEWGAGVTGVALKQTGGWTLGILTNHIWNVDSSAPSQSSTFLQPFLNYTTDNSWTFSVNTESTYDWIANEWTVPLNYKVSKLVSVGPQKVSLSLTGRHWAESPSHGSDDWGITLGATFLFPK